MTDLIERSCEFAGFGDQPDPQLLGYGRDSFETGCSGVEQDRYVGGRAAMRVDPDVDWLRGAERLAGDLETDGWTVVRWWWLDADSSRDERIVAAERGEDRVLVAVNANSIDISASSGPCNPTLERFDPAGEFQPVDSFAR